MNENEHTEIAKQQKINAQTKTHWIEKYEKIFYYNRLQLVNEKKRYSSYNMYYCV